MNNHPQQIFGYSDRFAARPGEALSFHVSCEHVTNYQASLVRLRHGFTGEADPGFLETPVPADFKGTYRGAWFACQPGSYVEVPDESGVLATPDDVLIEAHIFPTLPQGTRSGQFGAYHVTQNSFGESSGMQAVLVNWSLPQPRIFVRPGQTVGFVSAHPPGYLQGEYQQSCRRVSQP